VAAEPDLCRALADLKTEAAASRTPQRIGVIKDDAMVFACQRTSKAPAQGAFCDVAASAIGPEFTHAFPWRVRDCLSAEGVRAEVETVDQYTGLDKPKVTHLWAVWRDGVRLDVRFEPSGDFGPQPAFKDYWGAYRMVIWRP